MEELTGPGVTTAELNAAAEEMIAKEGGTPLFKGVKNPQAKFPFPAALCTSVNEEVVHGIPSDRTLCEGDIVSVDCGVRLDGYCVDVVSEDNIKAGPLEAKVQASSPAVEGRHCRPAANRHASAPPVM